VFIAKVLPASCRQAGNACLQKCAEGRLGIQFGFLGFHELIIVRDWPAGKMPAAH
tara:strand:- start:25849 stop:26013 length:165 start_codon:yes stop_codon:yes gene_type:complete